MADTVDVGAQAPDFTLPTDGGGNIQLSDMKGKKIVLYFYPKDDTPGCTKEAIGFSALKSDFDAAGAVVVGVSPDSPTKHDKFKAKHELSITLAADEETELCAAYGVWVERNMYGRRYMGVERSTFVIDEQGQVANVWRKVKVKGHPEQVLEAVRAL